MTSRYRIIFDPQERCGDSDLALGVDFRLDEHGAERFLLKSLPPRARDLMRVGMAVFVCDRLAKRRRSEPRFFDIDIAVREPGFWNAEAVRQSVQSALEFLMDDTWGIRFSTARGAPSNEFLGFQDAQDICLYSGGLDSAAGLAARLREGDSRFLAVTGWSQSSQRRGVHRQFSILHRLYGARISPLIVKSHLLGVPWEAQETSQRAKSFFITALGGAIACASGAW